MHLETDLIIKFSHSDLLKEIKQAKEKILQLEAAKSSGEGTSNPTKNAAASNHPSTSAPAPATLQKTPVASNKVITSTPCASIIIIDDEDDSVVTEENFQQQALQLRNALIRKRKDDHSKGTKRGSNSQEDSSKRLKNS